MSLVARAQFHRHVDHRYARQGKRYTMQRIRMRHRADDRAAIQDLRRLREQLADLIAGETRRNEAQLATDLATGASGLTSNVSNWLGEP